MKKLFAILLFCLLATIFAIPTAVYCTGTATATPLLASSNETAANNQTRLLDALEVLESNPAVYRLVVGLIVALIINICGFLSNKIWSSKTGYDVKQLADTLLLYEPLVLLLAEALPIEWAIVGAILVDVWRRMYKALASPNKS